MGDVMWIGISGVAAGTLGPILYAVYGKKRISARAAEGSMVIGLLSYLILYFGGIITSTMSAGAAAIFIGIIAIIVLAKIFEDPGSHQNREDHDGVKAN